MPSNGWLPIGIKPWVSGILVCVNISIITVIIILEKMSSANNGFTSLSAKYLVAPQNFSIKNFAWSYHLLWTALPGWLINLYLIGWSSAVSGAAVRQPYVELKEGGKHTARHTIMLDYRAYIAPNAAWHAFRRYHHWHVGCAIIMNLICTVALVPLSASLLNAVLTSTISPISLNVLKSFNQGGIDSTTDLLPGIVLTEATMVYNASLPAWSNTQYAFQPFSTAENFTGNLTGTVSGYGSDLECQTLVNGVSYGYQISGDLLTFALKDRGCDVPNQTIGSGSNSTAIFARTWSYNNCDAKDQYSRIGIIAGETATGAPSVAANFTLLSCIPRYYQVTGALTVSQSGNVGQVLDFNQTILTILDPSPYFIFQSTLPQFQNFAPISTYTFDSFSRLVYDRAKAKNPASPLDSQTLLNATQDSWAGFFTNIASSVLFISTGSRQATQQGTKSVSETRLFVYTPVAYTIVGVLILVLCCNIWLAIYTYRHHTDLKEEPKAIFGCVNLIENGNLVNEVQRIKEEANAAHYTEIRKFMKQKYDLDSSTCRYSPDTGITVTFKAAAQDIGRNQPSSDRNGQAVIPDHNLQALAHNN